MGKKLVLCKKSSKLATKVKIFFGSMGNTYKGSRNFRICKGVPENFSKKSNTGDSSPGATHGSGASRSNTSGDREHVEEGSHTANRASDWGVFQQYFLGWEKRLGKSTCSELKILKPVHSISAFQNVRLFRLRELLQEGDYMCKLDMKNPLHQSSRNYVRFSWSGNLYEFLCLCFSLGPAPRIFTKLLKIPVSVLRRINIWIVMIFGRYAYNGSNNGSNSHVQRHCNLPPATFRFVLNLKKSILNPVQEIEFLGVTINSLKMCLSLPQESVSGCSCQRSGDSSRTNKIVRPSCLNDSAQINFRHLQQQQIKALRATQCYQETVFLNSNSKEVLKWWIQNLQISNGRYLILPKKFLTIRTNASKKGWGAVCEGIPTGGEWDLQDQQLHIIVPEMKAVKLAYHKHFQMKAYSFPSRHYNSLVLSSEDGGNHKQVFNRISKRNLEVSPAPWDHNYCRIPSKLHERGGRLAVKKLKRQYRVETPSTSISENLSDQRKTRDGSFLLLDCQDNFHGTSHGNQIHTVREQMQCSKSGTISTFMLPHPFR